MWLAQKHSRKKQTWATIYKRRRNGNGVELDTLDAMVGYIGWMQWLDTRAGYVQWLDILVGYNGWVQWLDTQIGYNHACYDMRGHSRSNYWPAIVFPAYWAAQPSHCPLMPFVFTLFFGVGLLYPMAFTVHRVAVSEALGALQIY